VALQNLKFELNFDKYIFHNCSGDLHWSKSYGDINRSGEQVRHKRDLGTTQTYKVPNNYASPVQIVSTKTKNIKRNTSDKWTAVIQELTFH